MIKITLENHQMRFQTVVTFTEIDELKIIISNEEV